MEPREGIVNLIGNVRHIIFRNESNCYTVLSVDPIAEMTSAFGFQEVIVVGFWDSIHIKQRIDIIGLWEIYKQNHEMRLKVIHENAESIYTIEGLRRFLTSGQVKFINEKSANKILDKFGINFPTIIETDPRQLLTIPGIKEAKMNSLIASWKEKIGLRNFLIFLQKSEISNEIATTIYHAWKDMAINNIKENPYCIMQFNGVGFIKADLFALSLGVLQNSKERIIAGVDYALDKAAKSGHTFLPKKEMINELRNLIGVSADEITKVINANKHKLICINIGFVDEAIFTRFNYMSEKFGAENMQRINNSSGYELPPIAITDDLTDEQTIGLQNVLKHKISIITGGPGTGKSYCIRLLLNHLDKYNKTYSLAAPTGRAAKRIQQTTGRKGVTLHRLLKLTPTSSAYSIEETDTQSSLSADFFIIDEYSMVDSWLNSKLFEKLPDKAHVLLVGDVDQLPSVGAGNVLRDSIESDCFPVTRLTKIFRQESTSDIIINAHKINNGQYINIENKNGMFLFPTISPETAAKWIVKDIIYEINEKLKITIDDIQVLVPKYKGFTGVIELNKALQKELNPNFNTSKMVVYNFNTFYVDDRVMQIKNDYNKNVFNGDIGYIKEITNDNLLLKIEFDGNHIVEYCVDELINIVLAYAMTIHKSQGCEYPAVIIPLLSEHYPMLQRNLFYTAVTRASSICVLVGDTRSIQIAINNNDIAKRYTALSWFLNNNDIKDDKTNEYEKIEEYSLR